MGLDANAILAFWISGQVRQDNSFAWVEALARTSLLISLDLPQLARRQYPTLVVLHVQVQILVGARILFVGVIVPG